MEEAILRNLFVLPPRPAGKDMRGEARGRLAREARPARLGGGRNETISGSMQPDEDRGPEGRKGGRRVAGS